MNDFETLMINPEVLQNFDGFVCADKRGLCLEARGVMQTKTSGLTKGIMNSAKELTQTNSPTIIIEGENGTIVIKEQNDITVGVAQLNK